jgi:hypothetical protein
MEMLTAGSLPESQLTLLLLFGGEGCVCVWGGDCVSVSVRLGCQAWLSGGLFV